MMLVLHGLSLLGLGMAEFGFFFSYFRPGLALRKMHEYGNVAVRMMFIMRMRCRVNAVMHSRDNKAWLGAFFQYRATSNKQLKTLPIP